MADALEHRGGVTRVLVVAEQPFARLGLRTLLGERADVTVVGESSSIEEAFPLLAELSPDVIVAAASTESIDGVSAALDPVRAEMVPVVLLGADFTPAEVAPLLRGAARGILSDDATAEEIVAALQAVTQGMLVMEPRILHMLGSALPGAAIKSADAAGDEPLTERELEVLSLVALGLPNKTIASRLRISEHTVKFHVGSILAKLDASSRTEAVTRAARKGLLTL